MMKKQLVSYLVACASILTAFQSRSDESPKFNLSLRSQMESSSKDVGGETKDHIRFAVPYARFAIKGGAGVWDYQARFRLNKTADNSKSMSGINRNVDYAYIGYAVTESLKVKFGQQFSLSGSWEYYDGSFSQFLFSAVTNALPVGYDTGVEVGFQVAGQWFGVQVVNGASHTDQQQGSDLAILSSYYGNIANGMIKPMVSFASFPRHQNTALVANQMQVDDKVSTTHYAAGIRAAIGFMTLDAEAATLTTPAYKTYEVVDNELKSASIGEKTIQSYILNTQAKFGSLRPFLKFVVDVEETKGSEKSDTQSSSVGLFYQPDANKGDIHLAYVVSNKDSKAEEVDAKSVKAKESTMIIGYSLKI